MIITKVQRLAPSTPAAHPGVTNRPRQAADRSSTAAQAEPTCRKRMASRGVRAIASAATAVMTVAALGAADRSPADTYGRLFSAVQNQHVFHDGKTFADAVPLVAPAAIMRRYEAERPADAASLKAFVVRHFRLPDDPAPSGLRDHVRSLWSTLTRPPLTADRALGSALPLPAAYVVPGGRFREIYYWDSYFTMLGLRADGRGELVDSMLADFVDLAERHGMIPNGTRTYYLSRSQPPFFSAMTMLARRGDPATERRRLTALRTEHRFWMKGVGCIGASGACDHVVRMPDGAVLNRYWDARDTPRDESYAEDVNTAARGTRSPTETYRDLRSAAESGWDFSSRWLADPTRLDTVRTTSVVPVDLNSLLWQLERTIAVRCEIVDPPCARDYAKMAARRAAAMRRYLWDSASGRFGDWDLMAARRTGILSAATLYPLFVGLATPTEATAVAKTTRMQLLAPGGLRTTLLRTGQQWDSPNGWAPLQWIAVDGLERYGEHALAIEIAGRWLATVDTTYRDSGKMLEKYDVEERKPGGGGEYPLQDGFGWTNGVTSALLERYPALDRDRR